MTGSEPTADADRNWMRVGMFACARVEQVPVSRKREVRKLPKRGGRDCPPSRTLLNRKKQVDEQQCKVTRTRDKGRIIDEDVGKCKQRRESESRKYDEKIADTSEPPATPEAQRVHAQAASTASSDSSDWLLSRLPDEIVPVALAFVGGLFAVACCVCCLWPRAGPTPTSGPSAGYTY